MRSTRSSHNQSHINMDHEPPPSRRNDYYYQQQQQHHHHHHSSSSSRSAQQSLHIDSNGYNNGGGGGSGSSSGNGNDYRNSSSSSSSKRTSSNTGFGIGGSGSLIKRMKSVTSNTSGVGSSSSVQVNQTKDNTHIRNNESHLINVKSSSSTSKSLSTNTTTSHHHHHLSASAASLLNNIDTNECFQNSLAGYSQEENETLDSGNCSSTELVQHSNEALEKFMNATANMRKLVLEVLEEKKSGKQRNGGSSSGAGGKPSSSSSSNSTNEQESKKSKLFANYKVQGLMHLMEMKRLNRLDKYRLREARSRFNAAKEKVDKIYLQLQNLQYEVMHLQKEEKTCASFKSKDECLDLVDCSKFYLSDSVPQHLRHLIIVNNNTNDDDISDDAQQQHTPSTITISDDATNEERHQLHLARLDWELKQRIANEEDLKMAQESKYRLELEISTKKRTLAVFDPTLRNIIEASKPLVSQLNVPLQVYNTENELTPHLPQPLYVLFIQLSAYKGAFGVNYEVTIKGTLEEALEFEAKQKKESDIYFYHGGNTNDDDDIIASSSSTSSHHHHHKQGGGGGIGGGSGTAAAGASGNGAGGGDEDDDDEHRSKSKVSSRRHHQQQQQQQTSSSLNATANTGSNTTGINDSSILGGDGSVQHNPTTSTSTTATWTPKYSKLIETHPIKVNLMFRYRHYQLTITFTYFPKLELIGVHYVIENLSNSLPIDAQFSVTNGSSNVFSKLLCSSDTGIKPPNSTIDHLLRRYEVDSFLKLLPFLGFAYDWAQRLSGIEYLHPDQRPILSSGGIIRVKSSIAIDSLDKTIKALHGRFQARVNLQEQLLEIQTKRYIDLNKFESLLDSNEMFDNFDQAKLKPKSSIHSFGRITMEEFLYEMERFPKKKRQLVEYFDFESNNDDIDIGRSSSGSRLRGTTAVAGTRRDEDIFDENNFIFKLRIVYQQSNNDAAAATAAAAANAASTTEAHILVAIIIIPHNYPEKWPFFILNLETSATSSTTTSSSSPTTTTNNTVSPQNERPYSYLESSWLRSLEEHINVRLPLKVYQQAQKIEETFYTTTLLLRQIYDLQCGLDVIIDAQHQLVLKANFDQSMEVYSGPKSVNSLYSMSIVRGRDHSLQFL